MNKAVQDINLISYISWLELFTEVENSFYDDSFLYRSGNIKELEHGNAAKLSYFYKALSVVLSEAGIKPIVDSYRTYYLINYHGNNYEVGFMEGPETVYFCSRITPKELIPVDFSLVEKRLEKR